MASDDTEIETEADQLDDDDRDDLRELIREEIASVIADLRSADTATDPEPGAPDIDVHEPVSMTVRDIEAATERAVRSAMKDLRRATPTKKAAPKKKAPDPEPAPVDPPKTWFDRVRESAWK
jgi:hypothetical protein